MVLVDCHQHNLSEGRLLKSVIDQHIVQKKYPYYVAVSHEASWSSTLQVYTKMLGSGLDVDGRTGRILLKATWLEADPGLLTT